LLFVLLGDCDLMLTFDNIFYHKMVNILLSTYGTGKVIMGAVADLQ